MNRPKLTRLILAASAGLMIASASAASLNLLGFDDMSCAAWSKSKDDPDQRAAYVVWVRGFLTGHNYALPNQQVSSFSSSTLELKLNQYCSRSPTGMISDAAMRMSDELSGRNQPIKK
ncbi:hypothetical protein KI610_14925 [Ferribacterium limneticum]|nr:hypothetical protein KI610_14925 [Ferribacterium limneticum]